MRRQNRWLIYYTTFFAATAGLVVLNWFGAIETSCARAVLTTLWIASAILGTYTSAAGLYETIMDDLKPTQTAIRIPVRRYRPPAEPASVPMKRKSDGYVYLLMSPTGHYKIGHTREPKVRMKTFEIKLPFEVEFAHLIPTPDRFKLEKELHQKFADRRVNGEWFALTDADVLYIKSL